MSSIYRYTKIEYLLDLIKHARLPMIDPTGWEDKNDIFALEKSMVANETIGICCLTYSRKNSIYRWSKMSLVGISVRIEFDKNKIKERLKVDEHYRMKKVRYFNKKQLSEIRYKNKKDLAFVKHFSYEEEKEIRIVYREERTDNSQTKTPPSITTFLNDIPKDSIKGIRFSPYISKELVDFIKTPLLKLIKNNNWVFEENMITHSKILDYPEWQDIVKEAVL